MCKICKKNQALLFCQKNGFFYYLCTECNTLFLDFIPTSMDIDNYYKKIFNYQAGLLNKKRTVLQAKKVVNILKKYNYYGKNLLDIGSGCGYFLDVASEFGFNVTGIEPSKQLFDVALRRNRKIKLFNETLQSYLSKNNQKYDFITLIHVIEHLPNPIDSLNKITKCLSKNGVLY